MKQKSKTKKKQTHRLFFQTFTPSKKKNESHMINVGGGNPLDEEHGWTKKESEQICEDAYRVLARHEEPLKLDPKLFKTLEVAVGSWANGKNVDCVDDISIVFPQNGKFSRLTEEQVEPLVKWLRKQFQQLGRQ